MKLLFLKTLVQRRARDEGFTLPMVIALGLVMLLLGAVSITIANEENITAISQNSRSDALAIAEVGVARYRELLDRNRILAVNDSSAWGTINQVCDDNISSLLPSGSPPEPTPQTLLDSQDLDNNGNSTESIGSYSLVSYDYTNADNTSVNGVFNLTDDVANKDAKGVLTVRGKASDGSEAQIQVDIPIRINLDDMINLAPALWVGNSGITSLGNLTIGNGNVVIKDQASIDGCNGFSALASTTPRRPVISDSRDLPSIQKIIDDVANARNALSLAADSTINTIPSTTGEALFGTTTNKPYNPDSNTSNCPNIKLCRYYYAPPETTGLTYDNTNLLTDGVARTTLLLNQNLTINATTQDVKIGSTSAISSSDAFEIYVNGNRNIIINAGTGQTVKINGFIHAPESTLTITGSGTVNINGSVWVNDFVNSSATVNISPDLITREPTADDPSTSGRAYRFYSTTASRTPRPITGSPTNWKTEEVN
ncbi:MAG: hypothetical protein ACFCU7_09470 [Pleurocapsa sp.]